LLRVRLRTKEPVCLSMDQAATSQRRTLPFLTGSAVRGALVERYMRPGGKPATRDFAELFLSDHISFGNLYPVDQRITTWSDPLPFSAVTCKRYPGFYDPQFDPTHEERHGVRDVLLQSLVKEPGSCDEGGCQAELTVQGGFFGKDRAGSYNGVKLRHEISARTAIEAEREIALSQNLYSLETIAGGQEFVGFMSVPGREDDLGRDLLKKGGTLRIGTAKTRATGAVEVATPPTTEEAGHRWGTLEERLKEFRKAARRILHDDKAGPGGVAPDCLFCITLRSDTILLDRFLRHCPALNARLLEDRLKAPANSFQMIWAFSNCRWAGGWNAAQRLPKETELAISMGSVFLFTTTLADDQLLGLLQKLEREGCGERTQEGFGEVVICHPFHCEGVKL